MILLKLFKIPTGQINSVQSRRIINPPPELGSFLDEGENARIIQIDKTSDPLGATVRNEGESIIVGRVVKGGAAEKSGLLHEGDEIVAVNGVEMRGKTVAQVSDELANMHGKLTFVIIPNDRYTTPEVQPQTPVMHIKVRDSDRFILFGPFNGACCDSIQSENRSNADGF